MLWLHGDTTQERPALCWPCGVCSKTLLFLARCEQQVGVCGAMLRTGSSSRRVHQVSPSPSGRKAQRRSLAPCAALASRRFPSAPCYPNRCPGKLLLRHCCLRPDQHFYIHASDHRWETEAERVREPQGSQQVCGRQNSTPDRVTPVLSILFLRGTAPLRDTKQENRRLQNFFS